MRLFEVALESRLEMLLLRAIDSCESRNGAGPTVRELAADLPITPDFGHSQLVERLRRELSGRTRRQLSGRLSLTAAGREMVEGDTFRLQPLQQLDPRGEDISSEASLNAT